MANSTTKKSFKITGTLGKTFTNENEHEEFKNKDGYTIKRDGIFISIKNPEYKLDDIDTSGMKEGYVPDYAKEVGEYFNSKSNYKLVIYDEHNEKIEIDEPIAYGSEVILNMEKGKTGYYYPKQLKVLKFAEIDDECPFE